MATLRQLLLASPLLLLCSAAFAQPASPEVVINHEYDAMGNSTRRLVAPGSLNLATQTGYDGLHRPRLVTDPRGGRVGLDYLGSSAHLRQVIDPRALITQYGRTGLGGLTSLNSPDTGTTLYALDAAGNVRTRADARGVVAQRSYDALNRLTSIVYSDGSSSAAYTWTYDETGPGFANGIGRLTTALHPQGSSRYAYDAQGRVVAHTQRVSDILGSSSLTATVGYQYNAAGRLVRIAYPSGRVIYITQSGGRPSAISAADSAGATPLPLVSQIESTPSGTVASWLWHTDAGTIAHPTVLDLQSRPVRYRIGPAMRDLVYDAAGRITSYTHSDVLNGQPMTNLNQVFGYDELGRLTSATASATTWSLAYDPSGNRTTVHTQGVPATYSTAPDSNRLLRTDQPPRNYEYDAAGNTIGVSSADAPVATLFYDLAARLSGYRRGTANAAYVVDGLGRRVMKVTWSSPPSPPPREESPSGGFPSVPVYTVFVYDEAGQLIGEYDGASGTALREYAWLGSTPVAMFARNPSSGAWETFYIHADHLGAPRAALDRANRLRWSWLAEPFGSTPASSDPSGLGAIALNLRLPGQYFDAESGMHYNYFRDYDPNVGRYVQSDPIGLRGGINTYAYVESDPLSFSDPTGLIRHTSGRWIDCGGGCRIRIDSVLDEATGTVRRHLHWECRGSAGECGENGATSHGGTWGGVPSRVKECALQNGFNGAPSAAQPPAPAAGAPSVAVPSGATGGTIVGSPIASPLMYDPVQDRLVPRPATPFVPIVPPGRLPRRMIP